MARQLHLVDPETCKGDGICADICPENVLEMVQGKAATVEGRADACIMCGQCVAVCPTESLQMPDLPAEDFQELARLPFGYGEFFNFLQLRRSVRVFKNQPVEKDLTGAIIGLIPPIVDRSKILRKRYGIPKENKVVTSLILGHPKYTYKKSIRRALAGVRTI